LADTISIASKCKQFNGDILFECAAVLTFFCVDPAADCESFFGMTIIASIILRFKFGFRYSLHAIRGAVVVLAVYALFSFVLNTVQLITGPVGWEKPVLISPAGMSVKDYQFTSRGKIALVIYEGTRTGESGIFIQVSHDGGDQFIEPVALAVTKKAEAGKIPKSPSGAISRDGACAAVWQDYDESVSKFVIRYSISNDFGMTWDTPKTVETGTDVALIPKIFFDDENRVQLFFNSFANESFNLYHSIKEPEGEFTKAYPIAKLSSEMRGAFFPSFAVSGKNIFIAWQGKELLRNRLTDNIYFMHSSNYGRSFSSPERVTDSEASDASPFLTFSNGTLYLVYENNENKNWEIRLMKSSDMGDTWDKPIKVSSTNVSAYSPSVASVSADELAFFWYDSREVVNRVFTRRYGIIDARFSKETALSEGKEGATRPYGISFGDKLLSVWLQGDRIRGKFSDSYAAPPRVFSRTHPDGKWVKNSDAVIEWTAPADESGIAGFATLISPDQDTNPTIQNLSASTKSETLKDVGDGEFYYHIRTIDGAGNYSRTIHYPLRISKSPLPMPLIESKTHPERTSVAANAPVFIWQMTEIPRVKGFLYKLSPNVPGRPDVYTEKMTASFSDLPEGRYFFSVRAVDRTNTPGRTNDYQFIVGQGSEVKPEDIIKIIQDTDKSDETARRPPVKVARVSILQPADGTEVLGGLLLQVKPDLPKGAVLDRIFYEIVQDAKVVKRGSFEKLSHEITGLKKGSYSLTVKARFFAAKGQKASETPTAKLSFSIVPVPFEFPFDMVAEDLLSLLSLRILLPLSIMSLLAVLLLVKSNRRLVFSMFRIRNRIELFIRRVFEKN
jgi:hypothetical protein